MGDHEKIAKNKAELRAIKEKRRLAKEPDKKKIEESHNKWKDTHEKNAKVIKADSSKWDVDHEKIRKNKAELQAIKEKKRASKLAAENELKLRNAKKKETDKKFHNAHEQKPKKIAANSKNWDNDWEKINKQRAEIKAIKEKKRMSKLAKENELKRRNSQRKSYGNSAHEAKRKKMKGVDRNGLNEDKVNKKRAEIKALKEKKRIEKAQKAEAEALAATARGRSSSRSKKKSKATKIKTKKKKKADTESDSDSDDASHDEGVDGDVDDA